MDEPKGRSPRRCTVTIYDVARAAGVAPSTVSRAFSRPGRVNAETAERIRRIADDIGYRTAPIARPPTTTLTGMLAVVVPDIANPFFAQIVLGAQKVAMARGYTMVLLDSRESDRVERVVIERALRTVDGILLAAPRMSDSAIRMISKQKPVVVLNRAVVDVPCVVTDNARGAQQAIGHLGALGHDHLTYVAGPEASWADGMRWQALHEAGPALSVRVRRLGPFTPDIDGGLRAAKELLAHPTSAVVTYNDQLAFGVIRGLGRAHVRVPQDVSVVGFDNIFVADLVTPGLTTVAAPLQAEGATAARHLIALVQAPPDRTGPPVVLPVRLVVRASTAPPGGPAALPATSPDAAGSPATARRGPTRRLAAEPVGPTVRAADHPEPGG